MTDLAHIIALFQEGSALLSGFGDSLRQLGLGTGELTAGSALVALAVVWVVARVIRTVVSILFGVCLLLLLLQLAGVVELEALADWFRTAEQAGTF